MPQEHNLLKKKKKQTVLYCVSPTDIKGINYNLSGENSLNDTAHKDIFNNYLDNF